MSIDEEIAAREPWYRKGWGIMLIALGVMVLFWLGYVGIKAIGFYRQIQLGDIPPEVQGKLTKGNIKSPGFFKEELAYQAEADPAFGKESAPLQIVEFADFECPYSREASFAVRELQARFPDKIHFVYRDFPLDDVHPHAFAAAQAGACANEQGKFWQMHDKLFQNQDRLTDVDIKLYALEAGLDITKFNQCVDGQKYKDEIEGDRADGVAAGVVGTPTFFINGKKIAGAIPMQLWEQIIARAK